MTNTTEQFTVLIVEDEDEFRLLMRVFFQNFSHVRIVGEAVNGHEAVAMATEHMPDLVLLDVHMPRADGFAALEGIRGASPDTAVVFMSSDPDTRLRAHRADAPWVDKTRLMNELPGILDTIGISRPA